MFAKIQKDFDNEKDLLIFSLKCWNFQKKMFTNL